ncbi:hypothetical protein [Streptomyces niveus]|uniref:hypothetical protein n=1 Tax=Streptomyces niveus TaxID=193462 RepID=UPI003443B8A0
MTYLFLRHRRWTAESGAAGADGVQALVGALHDEFADELRERRTSTPRNSSSICPALSTWFAPNSSTGAWRRLAMNDDFYVAAESITKFINASPPKARFAGPAASGSRRL